MRPSCGGQSAAGGAWERSIHLRVAFGASPQSIAQLTMLGTEPVVVTGGPPSTTGRAPSPALAGHFSLRFS